MSVYTLLLVFILVALTMNFTRENHIMGRAMSIENQISMEEGPVLVGFKYGK